MGGADHRPLGPKDDVDLHRVHVAARIDHRPVKEITRAQISDVLDAIAKTAPRRADLVKIMLSSMWNWAIDSGRAEINPAATRQPVNVRDMT